MNYSNIDLDIENYDDNDLENFFNLGKKYNESDIEHKEFIIRNKILKAESDQRFQTNVLIFLNEAKRILIENLKINSIVSDHSYKNVKESITLEGICIPKDL